MATNTTLLRLGVVGSIIAALCCFSPLLFVLFSAVGVAAWMGYADYVLWPTLAIFVGLTLYALYRKRQARVCCAVNTEEKKP